MGLWTNSAEDTKTKMAVSTREKINKSGVYELEIKEAYITNSTRSKAVACTINATSEDKYIVFNLWFKKGDGSENESSKRLLNRLMFLCKLKASDLKIDQVNGANGKPRNMLKAFIGKKVGMILELKPSEYTQGYMDVNVRDFFDVKTQKTCDEIQNNEDALYVNIFKEKYKTATAPATSTPTEVKEETKDEFPF